MKTGIARHVSGRGRSTQWRTISYLADIAIRFLRATQRTIMRRVSSDTPHGFAYRAHVHSGTLTNNWVDQLLDEMERIIIYDPFFSHPPDSEEHQKIIDALRVGDAGTAQIAMLSHLRAVHTRVLERFK